MAKRKKLYKMLEPQGRKQKNIKTIKKIQKMLDKYVKN